VRREKTTPSKQSKLHEIPYELGYGAVNSGIQTTVLAWMRLEKIDAGKVTYGIYSCYYAKIRQAVRRLTNHGRTTGKPQSLHREIYKLEKYVGRVPTYAAVR